jgi:hypothetical protein
MNGKAVLPMSSTPAVSDACRDKLRRVAKYQRWMLLLLVVWFFVQAHIIATYGQHRSMIEHLSILAVFLVSLTTVFLLAKEFNNIVVACVGAILCAVPFVSLLVMYAVNYSAIKYLQQHEIKVGFFGVNPKTI